MESNSLLDYEGFAYPVEGLGPGRRLIMWVRGCSRQCPGCIAPELRMHGEPAPISDVAARLLPGLARVEGRLTISGGEPFDQPGALAALIELLREALDVEVLAYSGYQLAKLQVRGEECTRLLKKIDLLIDGPFLQEAPNTLQWRGSDNQRVHLLSERARERYAGSTDLPMPERRTLQVQAVGPAKHRVIGISR